MKTKKTYSLHIPLTILLSIFLSSCLKIGEYYLGLNLQPNMDNSPPLTGLNVFGILKTGPDFDTINHYFEVQQMIALNNMEYMELDSAIIQLSRTTNKGEHYSYQPQYLHSGLYFDQNIEALPGDRWDYSCSLDSFEVQASCIVPNHPQLSDSITIIQGQISFSVLSDESAFMYLVYIVNGEQFFVEKKIPDNNHHTAFMVQPNWEIDHNNAVLIYIFAYDKNLRTYITTSNTLFKPNAFRPSFSTVEGGYGTFGAVASSLFLIE